MAGKRWWNKGEILTIPTPLVVIFLLLIADMVAAGWLGLAGYSRAAFVVGNLGTLLILVGAMLWIGLVDSRHKWPSDKRWLSRVGRVLMFERSENYQRRTGRVR